MGKSQLLPLTGIRFLLAFWVVLFHQSGSTGYLAPLVPALPSAVFCLLRTSYVAVGIFFTLSGFVLAYRYPLDKRWDRGLLSRFATARVGRIYPVYCLGLLISAPIVANDIFKNGGLFRRVAYSALDWTLLQSWVPQSAPWWWNGPGWSLSNEAFFYACFPLLGVLLWRVSRPMSLAAVGIAMWIAAVAVPVIVSMLPIRGFGDVPATILFPSANPTWVALVSFSPLLTLPQFLTGILLARVYQSAEGGKWMGRGYRLYVPGVLLELILIWRAGAIPYPLMHNGLLLPAHALIILGLALGGGIPARLLSIRPLVFLGGASYSLYIIHVPICWWMNHFTKHMALSAAFKMAIYTPIVVSLSGLLFFWIEEPANRLMKRLLPAPPEQHLHVSNAIGCRVSVGN